MHHVHSDLLETTGGCIDALNPEAPLLGGCTIADLLDEWIVDDTDRVPLQGLHLLAQIQFIVIQSPTALRESLTSIPCPP